MERPTVWQMIKEAVDSFNGEIKYADIKQYLADKWGDVNQGTITDQIQVLTVNHKSRIHYPENHKPRLTNTNSPYDLLYTTGRGKVVKYSEETHGVWEIFKNETSGKLEIRQFSPVNTVNAYLFAWNPNNWDWTTLEKSIEQLQNSGHTTERWSCISHTKVKPGDRAFLVKVGTKPRGIIGSGYVVSEPFLSPHWGDKDKDVYRVFIEFDVLQHHEKDPILTLDKLKTGELKSQTWTPQSSGISIKSELIDELEAVWFDFLKSNEVSSAPFSPNNVDVKTSYKEGTSSQVIQTRYERNPHARKACIEHYGYSCAVCTFDFEKTYGALGKEFVHVHHLTQVALVGKPYEIDPIEDLRPVCPNCHAMLHKRTPPLTIDELKAQLN